MAFRAVGGVMVLRHADAKPDPADWNLFIDAFLGAPFGKLLVWSPGMASPNSEQRASAVNAFRRKGDQFRASVLTSSRHARGAATAISWFGPKIRGFSLDDLRAAIAWIEVAALETAGIESAIEALRDDVRQAGARAL